LSKRIEVNDLNVYYSKFKAVEDVTLTIEPRTVTAFIGPSGCGKSTFLRTLNRMHEVIPGARVEGEVRIDGNNLYAAGVDPVLAGVKLNNRRMTKSEGDDLVEKSLQGANLWKEVKDRLALPGSGLSGGQQQRLCIARAIAVSPEVILMDEPCSALDPISTLAIEDLIEELKTDYTIVIVTHNMQQASRVSDKTAFFNIAGTGAPGKLIEYDDTATMFSKPSVQATEDYVSGKFGAFFRGRALAGCTTQAEIDGAPPGPRRGGAGAAASANLPELCAGAFVIQDEPACTIAKHTRSRGSRPAHGPPVLNDGRPARPG
jgi:phosphate transport system ATP-binding protein